MLVSAPCRSASLLALAVLTACAGGDLSQITASGSASNTFTGPDSTGDATTGTPSDETADTGEETSDSGPVTSGPTTSEDTTTSDESGSGTAGESCSDQIQNQDETDVDCGGSCSPCGLGESCMEPSDCTTRVCTNGVCEPPACVDDADCSVLDDQCVAGVCGADQICTTEPANEGLDCEEDSCMTGETCSNGSCGGGSPVDCSNLDDACNIGVCDPVDGCVVEASNEGGNCDDGDMCTVNTTCSAGACGGGSDLDCSNLDDDCNVGVCDSQNGCQTAAANEGAACNQGDPCGGYVCGAGACVIDQPLGLVEDFSDNSAGWTLGTEWQIGSAVAGCGDPGVDHTPTADNGVAGVVLGGCAAQVVHSDYCLESPAVDSSGWASATLAYWRDLYSDYTPYMKNKIEVWNGASWTIIFETFGSPGVNDANWTYFEYDISAYTNAQMRVRWCFNIGSSGVFARGSWNIDDVQIVPSSCVQP